MSQIGVLCPRDPRRGQQGPQGDPGGAQSDISTPLWDISTPHWTSHIPHVCPGGVPPTVRKRLYRMAWSSNPMEASPLVLRSVTVLPRALLEVSPYPPVGATTTTTTNNKQQTTNKQTNKQASKQTNNNNPACINNPL